MAQTKIIAHRGASGSAPENTLVSFSKAIEAGSDFIELDIHLSKDGELIVMHDETVNRTTNGKGKIRNMNLNEIKGLDAGSWFGKEYKNIVVPTLDEVLLLVSGKNNSGSSGIKILIEVKGSPQKYKGIEKKLINTIYKYYSKEWCIIQSFDEDFLINIHNLDSTFVLHQLLIGKIFPSGIPDYISAINPNHHFVTGKKIEKLHLQNKKIFVWTVNDPGKMKKLIEMGVDGIITNFPNELSKLISK